jgi:predicted aspartyl protease
MMLHAWALQHTRRRPGRGKFQKVLTINVLRHRWRVMLRAGVYGALLVGMAWPVAANQGVESPARPEAVAAETELAKPALLASPTTRDHIGRVLVKVRVNGRGPFAFVVDTGASHSTVSPSLVKALDLDPNTAASMELQGITGSAVVPGVMIDKLQAGEWTIEDTAMPVLWAPVMAGADGILGAAGLTEQSLVIDFLHDRVMIAGTVEAALRIKAMRVHAIRLTDGLMTVDANVAGVPLRAVIDTGAERSLCNAPLRDALNRKRSTKATARVTSVYGATQDTVPGELVAAPIIAVGALRVANVDLVCGDFHIFEVWGMRDKPAMVIGMDVLGTVNSLGIDFKHHDIYVGGIRNTGESLPASHIAGSGTEKH